ncbi:MAG TPA: MupA/Atu3671 family FMN-dependent luciferase-like monooxygenase, partial [Thermoanaerobaculia bacterium]|nr:MupA/Atu3671 family FMN-dependent luciferase-like monooxygenase [Thermoanaerobaculia bacterium]
HGTGTRLGDPIEAAALAAALRARTGRRGFCALGSVKTNLGHLDAGAGIAGLLKTALSLEHGQLPPSLNFSAPNPEIDFSDSPIYVNATLKTWPQSSTPRRAGVSSFGIGGTNAHAILEEAPEVPSGPSREQQLLVWSAKTEEAADAATGNLERALTSSGAPSLADAAFTLATGRRAFEHRRALVCRQGFDAKRVLADQAPPGRRPVAFLIPGQGSQRPGATGGIYAAEKVFRAEVDRCAKILLPHLGSDLREVLYPQGGDQENAERRLQETAWAQPAVFVTGYALARLWMSWGVQPQALLGHSLGEYVAACLAGVLPLDEALALVALRGRLMGGLSPGGMLAVPLGEAEAAALLPPDLSLAAVNGPQRTVLSGPLPAIEDLERRLAARGLEGRRLRTSHAFHSAMLEPVLPAFAERLRAIPFQAPRIPYLSNVTGDWITAEQAVDPTFWLRQLREPVRFGDAAGRLLEEGNRALLEVGAGRALAGLARQHPLFRPEHRVVSSLASAPDADSTSESAEILEALGRLWASGVAVDWPAYYRGEQRRRVSLPSYPFERRRYFVDRPAGAAAPWTELAIRQQQLVQDNDLNDLEMGSMNRDVEEAPSPARLALVGMLKEIIRDLTGVDAAGLDPEAAFLDIGVDSLLMVQAAQRVRDRLGVKLSVVQLLEELTTLDKVAWYLEAELPAEALAGLAPRALTPQPPLPSPPQPPGEGAPPDADLTATASAPGVETRGYAPAPTRGAAPSPPAAGGGNAPEGHRHVAQGFNPGLGEGASDLTQLFAQQLQVLSQVMAQQNQILLGAPAAPAPQAHPAPPPPPPAVQSPAPTPSAPPTPSAWTPIAVFHPIDRRPPEELSPQQKEYLDQFIARYTARTAKSKQLSATYRPVLADGRFTVSFRRMWKEIVYPIHSQRSKGSRIWDVDGNEYVDISMGFGLHFFGHSPEFLNDALERQLRRGIEVGPQLAQTGRAAEMLCALTGMDRAMFCATGTEAVLGALRVARTVTGRSKIVIFTDSYHGWSDATMVRRPGLRTVPGAPGISPRAIEEVIVLDYGTEDAIEQLAAIGHEIAAVLVEPVRSRFPDVQPREFLHALRRVTEQTGALLIFDEIVTGFRIHPGGAQEHFGVRADLATYGKMISAGLPIGAVAGRAAYMDALDGGTWRFGDDSYPMAEKTLFTGSYFKHPLTMAAACAVLEHLQREGPALQEQLNARTARLTADLNSYFQASGVPIEAVSFASLFRFRPAREMQLPELFYFHLVDHGIYYTQESGNCFLTTAHTDEDVLRIRRAVAQSVEDLAAGGFLPGAHPVPMPAMPELRETKLAADRLTLTTIGIRSRVNQAPEEQIRRMPFSVPLRRGVDFSLSYFGPYEARFEPAKYDLLLTGARFADEHGFTAVWLPERHFHPFGGFSPNPSVLAAALARETKHLQLRAGSTVVPLHHPIRLAEEWSVVDNLSGGRAGVSFASGWHANDFVFAPAAFESRHEAMFEGIEKIRSLWRGEPLHVRDGLGTELDVLLHPLPKQREIPIWLTGSSPAIFAKAGAMGAGILTNLQSQPLDELAEKIGLYYEALVLHGHDPASGRVTLLLHTFVGEDLETARAQAEVPLRAYLRASFDLNRKLVESQGREVDFDAGSESDLDYVLDAAYERFVSEHALVGTPESCAAVIEKLIPLGVTEIGCLIDFGVDPALVAASLPALDRLRQRFAKKDYAELPVTDGQRVLWLASKMSPMANRSYNEPLALRLRGRLNVPHLHAALQTVSDRHQALRSSFSTDGRQKIADPRPEALPLIDYSGLPEPLRSREVLWCLKTWAGEVFDLENGPLLRVCLLRLAAEDHYLSLVAHHIVIDGGSAGVMVRELTSLYAALSAGAPNPLGPPGSFAEYVLRVCSRSPEAPDQLAAEAFWREVFARPVSLLELPLDRPRPRTLQFWGDRPQYQMEPELMRGLRQLAAREKSTPYAVVLAAFGALLQHLTRHDDIIVGVPSRDPSVTGAMVGYFINLLPVRMQRLTGDTFSTLQARVKRELLGVLEHQNFPLNRLLEKLGLAGGLDGFLIGCTFNVERLEEPQPMVGVECEYAWIYHDAARIDLHVNLAEEARSGGAQVDFAFKTTTYDRASVERWAGAFFAVLRQIVGDSAARLDALSLLSPAERQQLIVEHNDTQDGAALAVIAAGACLHTLVEEQAARRPAAPAVALGSEGLSYGDLNRLADHLAGKLKKLGVGPEVKVGLCLDRSLELIVSLLAILKAGGAYVPLEPGQPRDRLVFFLEDAKIPLLLARRAVIDKLGDGLGTGTRALDMDVAFHEVWSAGTAPSPVSTTPATTPDPDHLAYVIYTSGSTGTPNGVPVSHRAAVNLVRQMAALYGVGPHSRIPLVAALSFDVSVFEMFTALGFGGCLCLIRDEERANPFLLADRLASYGVTTAFFTPTTLSVLPEPPLAGVPLLGVGGEASPNDLVERWSRGRRLLNCYGPTEATVFATVGAFADQGPLAKSPPIGRPIGNLEVHLVDPVLRPVPLGVTGEIAIGGTGVARGYLGRPQKTAQRFVPDPFAALRGEAGARLYLTGDLARRQHDGRIEYLGRADGQIKLRGVRIELGEIESLLRAQPGVLDVAVDVRGDKTNQVLAAAVVWEEDWPEKNIDLLQKALEARLPEAMIPATWVELKALPRTANGKLDRLALRAMQDERTRREHVEPETALERFLVDLFREVLHVDRVGLHNNFLELGGNSINGAMLAFHLQESLGEDIHAIIIFDAPTVAELAHFLAVRFPDKVMEAWGEESLPESVRQAILEMVAGMDEEELKSQEGEPTVTGVGA